jgi:hypothetical protein
MFGITSLINKPLSQIFPNSCEFSFGYRLLKPPASTEIVVPLFAIALECAAVSMPYAPPLTMLNPALMNFFETCLVTSIP